MTQRGPGPDIAGSAGDEHTQAGHCAGGVRLADRVDERKPRVFTALAKRETVLEVEAE